MEQRTVLIQTTRLEEDRSTTSNKWMRWMRYFFTEDGSADDRPLIELQRRITWISLAIVLQALNEIDQSLKGNNQVWYTTFLGPFRSLIPFGLVLGSFVALWMAFRPTTLKEDAQQAQKRPRPWQRLILVMTLCVTIAGIIQCGFALVMAFSPPMFSNDGTTLDTNAAMILLKGHNPYTESNMLDMARRFPIHPNWTTPLRLGQFANRLDYPSLSEFQTVLDTDLKQGVAPEFESKVSYPALSFLTLVPFAFFKDYNVLPLYLGSYLLLVFIAWKVVRRELRPWVILLSIANVPMWTSILGGNLDIFYTLLIVLAWLLREHRWRSSLFLGLAIATKQLAWFFIPFYAIIVFRRHGFKEALYRLSLAGALGLAFNLPFILWNPHAWLAGILAPVADPMFPLGIGLIGLSTSHLLPFFSGSVYTALEGAVMLFSLVWYWRLCRTRPEAALLLAVLPLFVAWRSLPSYFYCVAFPLFVLIAARNYQLRPQEQGHETVESERDMFVPESAGLGRLAHSPHAAAAAPTMDALPRRFVGIG